MQGLRSASAVLVYCVNNVDKTQYFVAVVDKYQGQAVVLKVGENEISYQDTMSGTVRRPVQAAVSLYFPNPMGKWLIFSFQIFSLSRDCDKSF